MSAPPSVTIFLHALRETGVAKNALALAHHLAGNGWSVEVVTCEAPRPHAFTEEGVSVFVLGGTGIRRGRAAALAAAVPALRRHLLRQRPDILLSAGNHAHLAVWAASRGLTGPKRVYRISNDLAHPGQAGLRAAIARAARSPQFRLLARDAAAFGLVSATLLRGPVGRWASRGGRVSVIPNGVDIAACRRAHGSRSPHPWLEQDPPVVLAIGRLAQQKNYPVLLQALARVQAIRPMRLIVLGRGAPTERRALMRLAARLGIAECTAFPGTADPFPYLARADVFALPSLWEGASNVLLEALACGVPIVASRSAGNARDVLANGRYGRLVDPADPEDIANALLAQCAPDTVIRPGDRAEAFALDATMASWRALLESLHDAGG